MIAALYQGEQPAASPAPDDPMAVKLGVGACL
jgi:phosphonate transport system ATP-binding protein